MVYCITDVIGVIEQGEMLNLENIDMNSKIVIDIIIEW